MKYNRSITATVYVVKDGCVLLHRHKKYNTWFPPGGHLEPDELPHETALREVIEETGLHVSLVRTEIAPPIELARVERIPAPFCMLREGIGSDEEFLDLNYIAVTDEEMLHPCEGESNTLRWFSREDLLNEQIKPHIQNTALAVLDFMQKSR